MTLQEAMARINELEKENSKLKEEIEILNSRKAAGRENRPHCHTTS